MTLYTLESATSQRTPVQLTGAIAQGAAGTIHHVVGRSGMVVKLYKNAQTLTEYEEKIGAMLNAPPTLKPFTQNGRTYVQIAWPTGKIFDEKGSFAGFAMPEVDFHASTELENMLQKSSRKLKKLPEFYGVRVLLAANMAALCAELHKLEHYMVDMKPVNMRFYPQSSYMAILDTDGFSINGTHRLPARQFSDEYIAPEAKGKNPEVLGFEQDCFSLAVIIFRLLNNGIHPFQGVDHSDHPTNLQDRIFAGLYAYGITPHRNVGPTPSSIHEYLEPTTRKLFDRAFTKPHDRPSASEWRDHLNKFIVDRTLLRCAANEAEHAHFSLGCGLCALEQRRANIRQGVQPPPIVQSSGAILGTLLTGSKIQQPQTPRHGGAPRKTAKVLAAAASIAAIIAIAGWNISQTKSPPATAEVPKTPATTLKISNAVLANTIENDKPKDISRIFAKPGAPIALRLDYRGAKPGVDTILLKVQGGGETFQPCELTKLTYVDGSFNCKWLTGAAPDQLAIIEVNGNESEWLSFKVTPPAPPPRPSPDNRPSPPSTPSSTNTFPPTQPLDPQASQPTSPFPPVRQPEAKPLEPPLRMSNWGLMLKEMLDNCWRRPRGRREPQGAQISLGITLTPHGALEQVPRPVRAYPPIAQSYHDRVVRALYECQPYRLPPTRFNEWRYIEVTFSDFPS
jgi:hypothetical protein